MFIKPKENFEKTSNDKIHGESEKYILRAERIARYFDRIPSNQRSNKKTTNQLST